VYTIPGDRGKMNFKAGRTGKMAEDTINWENRYRTNDTPWETGRPSTELVRVVTEDKIVPCPALELGCGTGTNAVWMAQRGFAVTAIDLSPLAIERARAKATAANVPVQFVAGDLTKAPELVGPFGFFFDRGVYHIVRTVDLAGYLRVLERSLKPGAMGLVLAGNAKFGRTGPPIVTEDEIRGELGKVLEIVRLREFDLDPVNGQTHLAWSCLVRS
jgi:SAM-dependent methyltransferase